MTNQAPESLQQSDYHKMAAQSLAMTHVPVLEVTQMHIFHHPDNALDVNGFNFLLRDAEGVYTLSLREGCKGDGVEPVDAIPYETGGSDYIKIVESRGEILADLQTHVAKIGALLSKLMADLKG